MLLLYMFDLRMVKSTLTPAFILKENEGLLVDYCQIKAHLYFNMWKQYKLNI